MFNYMVINVSNKKSFARTFIVIVIVCSLSMCSCGTSRISNHASRIEIDTVYMTNQHYDSIYIYKDRLTDHSKDTIYIKDVSIEYRYKLLRDTIKVLHRDSIPYEVTIIETRELTRPLTWFDHLTRATFWILLGFLIIKIYGKIRGSFTSIHV